MAGSDYVRASNGEGEAVRAFIIDVRDIGDMNIITDSVLNWPNKFIATSGTLDPLTGLMDEATMTIFRGHLDGSIMVIDEFAPGYTDEGNTADQVVLLKPTTAWADAVGDAIDNVKAITVSPTAPTAPSDGDFWLDESVSGGTAVDTDSAQTLTNKVINGADNTFSDIPLTALDNSDTGWIDMTAKTGFALLGSTESAKARMKNGVVYIQGGFSNTGISANGSYTIGNLPVGITAPAENLIGRFGTSSGAAAATFFVTGAGEILLRAGATVSSYYKFGGQSYII